MLQNTFLVYAAEPEAERAEIPSLEWAGDMELAYAREFQVDYYRAAGQETEKKKIDSDSAVAKIRNTDTAAKTQNTDTAAKTQNTDTAAKTQNTDTAAKIHDPDLEGVEYALITIHSDQRCLLVEEDAPVPEGLPDDMTVLQKPLDHIYAASSSCPDFFRELGVLDQITMTSTKARDWTIPSIRKAVSDENMAYVGKYSAPDYEYILDEGCDLCIENTMIFHAPEVSEMLKRLGIPVLIEYSSYETEPLGRLEWIRLYGLLTDRMEAADAFFQEQVAQMRETIGAEGAGRAQEQVAAEGAGRAQEQVAAEGAGRARETIGAEGADRARETIGAEGAGRPSETIAAAEARAPQADVVFFYISSNQSVNVRREHDYVSRMIEMAGGRYMLHDLVSSLPASETQSGSISLQMESFYAAAKNADVLIYNGTLGESLETIEELKQKNPLLGDFKAVKNGRVYCSKDSLFQEVTGTCRMILDFFYAIRGQDGEDGWNLTFLRKLTA